MVNTQNNCPICSGKKFKTLKKYEQHFLIMCKQCGFVFSSRLPEEAELLDLYHTYTYTENYYVSPITIIRYKELLDNFEKYRKLNRILELGCGYGIFLDIAKEMGWECYGIEVSEQAVVHNLKKGLNVYKGKLKNVVNQLPLFDVVVAIEVIEHLSFPNEEIKFLKQIIRQGGLLYITTPNFNSLSRILAGSRYSVICYPEHVSYFTPKTIKKLLSLHDFNILSCHTTGFSMSRMKRAFNLSIENPYSYESTDEKIRRITESSRLMKFLKKIINNILNFFRIGNTIKVFAVKSNI